jgi:hypothetical protein
MKEGKLIKLREGWYNLFTDTYIGIASTYKELQGYKLSSINCFQIENNLDIDKIAVAFAKKREGLDPVYANGLYYGFVSGFEERHKMIEKVNQPDPKLIDSMCLRYRHDFLLIQDKDVKDGLRITMKQIWEEVVGLGFYECEKEWMVDILWETENPTPLVKRKVTRLLDNGEKCQWTCFWDNGWFSQDGCKIPNVIDWEKMPILDKDGCLILKAKKTKE